MEELEKLNKSITRIKWIDILLLIMIVGLLTFNYILFQGDTDVSVLPNQDVNIFNSRFSGFEGDLVKAKTVEALIKTVNLSNSNDIDHIIKINGFKTNYFNNELNENSTYTVKFEYENDFINNIIIEENK